MSQFSEEVKPLTRADNQLGLAENHGLKSYLQ
jgi:hypothetical protein